MWVEFYKNLDEDEFVYFDHLVSNLEMSEKEACQEIKQIRLMVKPALVLQNIIPGSSVLVSLHDLGEIIFLDRVDEGRTIILPKVLCLPCDELFPTLLVRIRRRGWLPFEALPTPPAVLTVAQTIDAFYQER